MAERFSLKDHLFNPQSLSELAAEYAAALPDFDSKAFMTTVIPGLDSRELLERLEWISDCIQGQLNADFSGMADQLEVAMPVELNPDLTDDDFGRFIHAVPGILAVRHGLEEHRERALDLIHEATKRFSMEFYIRPFLNRWPDETWERLIGWAKDQNYHVRRLVSEGTRPKLPWAKGITIDPLRPLELLDILYTDPTRYVTRSVANHLNDISKIEPDAVLARLKSWRKEARQTKVEFDWIERHALRTLIKQGHANALAHLGYRNDLDFEAALQLDARQVAIGDAIELSCEVFCKETVPVLIDYVMYFHKPGGAERRKVFKWKQAQCEAGTPLQLRKQHRLKKDASTFTIYPGPHRVELQINGQIVADTVFTVR
ncbi:hypothetical protein ROA7450_02486 [Roseovarius albus]|uniref:DNA alkylation repair enzyme n=1 Tax=Roseovarius albus TaxID=1247867 RepID=A0A1X6ZFT8_9RHOB|nr:hypothetical protein [Roseovarius albus]SLN50220.1 hypothetical protein ROA7450_02486 [Roseovarius albus]